MPREINLDVFRKAYWLQHDDGTKQHSAPVSQQFDKGKAIDSVTLAVRPADASKV